MILKILEMNEIDIDAHAKLVYDSRQNSPLRNDSLSVEGINGALTQLVSQGEAHAMIVALDQSTNELLGQLLMMMGWGEIGLAGPWQPIVKPGNNQDSIAVALIEHAKQLVETHSKTKLEIWMEPRSEQVVAVQPIYEKWYRDSGFILSSQEYFMDGEYLRLKEFDYLIPEEIEIISMSEITNDELKDIVYETFRSSSDEWVLNLSPSQLEGVFEEWLKRDETFNGTASIVFKDGGKIIGYNVMRLDDDSVEIGPVGVSPSHRRRGLGRALILESLNRISKIPESVSLTVSTGNIPAFELYSNLGFEMRYTVSIYSWTP
ncbi:MAG: GNAT family N-acetyltransferase [Candidatus Thorarchaeota archaeon]